MRKFYTLVNVLTFGFVLYYLTSGSDNPNMKHAALVLGIISFMGSGYMTFFEYTEDPEKKYNTEMSNLREKYNSKVEEFDKAKRSLLEREEYMKKENQQLVQDVMESKKIANQLMDTIDDIQGEQITGFQPENHNFAIDPSHTTDPTMPVMTQNNQPNDFGANKYNPNEFGGQKQPPPMPDFLKPQETKPNSNQNY